MKALIASDIHGNLEYTEKLDKLLEKEQVDKIILLGDLLTNYYFYDQEEISRVIKILNKRAGITISVLGNCDKLEDQNKLNFNITKEYQEIELDNIKFYISHGHLNNKYNYLFKDNYLLSGHTHIYNLDGTNINPGSVGYPRKYIEHTCIIYNNHKLYLINLDNYHIIKKRNI